MPSVANLALEVDETSEFVTRAINIGVRRDVALVPGDDTETVSTDLIIGE